MSYIPLPIVTDIVRRVSHSGFRELAPFIVAGPEWRKIVFSDEVLSEVCLDEFIFTSPLANAGSPYRPFLLRCLRANNKTAIYVEGLRRAAQLGPSTESLDMLGIAGVGCLYSRFAFGVFLICCGSYVEGDKVLKTFLQKVPIFEEAVGIADMVVSQIAAMGTPGQHAYRRYMHLGAIPECGLDHHTALDVCPDCFALTYAFQFADLC